MEDDFLLNLVIFRFNMLIFRHVFVFFAFGSIGDGKDAETERWGLSLFNGDDEA